jgi:cytochrome P450
VDPVHGKLTAKEIVEEFITLRGAGHETTSNTVSWALLLLAQHQEVQLRVHQEACMHVAGRSATYDELERLVLCKMTVYEALRLYPTIPAYPRYGARFRQKFTLEDAIVSHACLKRADV